MHASTRPHHEHGPAREPAGAGATVEAARWYAVYAAASLAVTVLAGTWLRSAMLHPPLLGGHELRHAMHAHSHVALFGWTTMALFAFIVRAAGLDARWVRWHAHATGLATAAAFLGFLQLGYTTVTIIVATLHVALWFAFAIGSWRSLRAIPGVARGCLRAALCLLLVAGLGAMAPGIVRARGVTDPWLLQLSVELFLAPFLAGWLGLGAAGVLYARLAQPRHHRAVAWLLAAGALPSALLRVPAAAPSEWLPAVGRIGMACVGAAAVLLAIDLLRTSRPLPLFRIAGAFALLQGVAEIGAAAGATLSVLGNHQLKVAYLHLVLLGVVTPALLGAVVCARVAVGRLAAAHAAGLLVTLAAVAALGLPPAAALLATVGIGGGALPIAALAGGALSAAAILGMLLQAWRSLGAAGAATAGRRPADAAAA